MGVYKPFVLPYNGDCIQVEFHRFNHDHLELEMYNSLIDVYPVAERLITLPNQKRLYAWLGERINESEETK